MVIMGQDLHVKKVLVESFVRVLIFKKFPTRVLVDRKDD